MELLIFIIIIVVNISLASNCHKNWPSIGRWFDNPPYFEFEGCHARHFSHVEARQCLHNRTVYVVGSTIARQFAFHMTELLGAPHANRTIQKIKCPKHDMSSQGCILQQNSIKVKYLYLQYIDGFNYSTRGGFPYHFHQKESWSRGVNSPLDVQSWWQYPTDVCTHASSTLHCLQKFFHGSTSRDILIFNVGLTYGYNLPNTDIDVHSWLRASAIAFKANLQSVFAGNVFRVTMSQLTKRLSNHSPLLYEMDELLQLTWNHSAVSGVSNNIIGDAARGGGNWFTIDQWAINRGRDHLYVDRIHYPGNLSMATLYQVMSTLCVG